MVNRRTGDKKVFIIEHNRLVGLDIQLQLEKNGCTVFRPLSIVDAEVIIRKDAPDLIIADTDIQQQDNFERVKKLFSRRELPIIYIGTINEITAQDSKLNIIGTFSKPFDSKKIACFVDNYFDSGQWLTNKREK
ncbi:MAG TPA: response regulator [Candidatus Nanoarchaeia archaeon]|nr:response regulator [Candidatus Nanoarchaeia archaeon]